MGNAASRYYSGALYSNVGFRDLENVKYYIEKGADVNLPDSETGKTSLILAALNNDTDILKVLLEAGAKPNVQNYDGKTALMFAALRKNSEAVTLLLDAGADPNIKNEYEDTALTFATETNMVVYVENKGKGITLDIVKQLLEAGADPNFVNRNVIEDSPDMKHLNTESNAVAKAVKYQKVFNDNIDILNDFEGDYNLDLDEGFLHIDGGCIDLDFYEVLTKNNWTPYV